MRLGGKIYLRLDDYKKLLHNEYLSIGKESQLVFRQVKDDRGDYGMELGFELGLEEMPSRELMLAWINALYDQDEALMFVLKEKITEQLMGRKVLEQ